MVILSNACGPAPSALSSSHLQRAKQSQGSADPTAKDTKRRLQNWAVSTSWTEKGNHSDSWVPGLPSFKIKGCHCIKQGEQITATQALCYYQVEEAGVGGSEVAAAHSAAPP